MSSESFGPFGLPGHWYKGNLHTHTTQSDGEKTPLEAIAWYRDHGYDFMAITDHWVLTRGCRVTGEFATITGSELDGAGYHLLCLGLQSLPDHALRDDVQATVRQVVRAGGLGFFAHPYWTPQHAPAIAPVDGIVGIEVFNSVCEEMDGLGMARTIWDELLGGGRRLMGLAVDDVHWRQAHQAEGKGYVMVRAAALDEASLLRSLALGHFYSSMGPRIDDLRVVNDEGRWSLQVRCSPCRFITFHAHGPTGHRFAALPGSSIDAAALQLRPEQSYVRVECQDWQGLVAWTNPVYLSDILLPA